MNPIHIDLPAVIWFKKDLRVFDHEPLFLASLHSTVIPMYIVEPFYWQYGDLSYRHYQFVKEGLHDLQKSLQALRSDLFVAISEIETVLNQLYAQYGRFVLYSHREHGLQHTYDRDKHVRAWIDAHNCEWHESIIFAVARYPHEYPRQALKKEWLDQPFAPKPKSLPLPIVLPTFLQNDLSILSTFYVSGESACAPLKGGEQEAIRKANEFFKKKYKTYNLHRNRPSLSFYASSQLSPYLTWGNLSLRVLQRSTSKHLSSLKDAKPFEFNQLDSFSHRLQWHCSFVQAVESDPYLDVNPRDPSVNGLRHKEEDIIEAFKEGKTGIPFVDACILSLKQTGWINFKQRAMLASFATNTLLIDYKIVGTILAHLWLDYEPGIHWFQMQLQSGLIPEQHIPLYDVIKQSRMHDEEGHFIKQWIPRLKDIDKDFIYEPWKLIHNPYLPPIVNYRLQFDITKQNLYALKTMKKSKKPKEVNEVKQDEIRLFDIE